MHQHSELSQPLLSKQSDQLETTQQNDANPSENSSEIIISIPERHSKIDFSQDSEESVNKKERERLSRISYRNKIALEILETERNYIKNLNILIGLYVLPLRTIVGTEDEIVGEEELRKIFSNVELLVKINSELLHQLHTRMENWSETQLIGDVFDNMAPHFKLYTDYGKNYLTALNTLNNVSQGNTKFADFMQMSQKIEDNNNLTMHAFLIAPIQRLPRIILLLNDLKNHTPEDHPDYKNIGSALQKFQHVTDHVNEGIKYAENTQKMVELQKRFAGNVNFLQPARKFIREGPLDKITSRLERHCWFFLFNDIFVYAYEIMGYFHHKGTIPLDTAWIRDLPDTSEKQNMFQVVSEKKTYTLYASSPPLKYEWINDLNAQIAKLVELNPSLVEKRSGVKVRNRGGFWKPLSDMLGQSVSFFDPAASMASPTSDRKYLTIDVAPPPPAPENPRSTTSYRTSLRVENKDDTIVSDPSWCSCSACNIL